MTCGPPAFFTPVLCLAEVALETRLLNDEMTSNQLLSNRVFMDARSAEYSTVVGVQILQRFTDDQTNAYLWPLLVLN